jgi:hypothetical protein
MAEIDATIWTSGAGISEGGEGDILEYSRWVVDYAFLVCMLL